MTFPLNSSKDYSLINNNYFRKHWRPRRTCQYPLYSGWQKQLTTRNAVSPEMSTEITGVYGQHVPPVSRKSEELQIGRTIEKASNLPIFWANFGRLKNRKYKSYNTLISNFSNSVENGGFTQNGKRGSIEKSSKMANFLGNLGRLKNTKYKSYNTLIGMD